MQQSRRAFIQSASAAAAGITLAPIFSQAASPVVPQPPSHPAGKLPLEEKLAPLLAETEQSQEPLTALPFKDRLGVAVVGLGHLAIEQILPAFAASRMVKPVALVSGDFNKAKKVASQYNISEKSIYTYQNFDEIRHNPDIHFVYIVLPNSMHKEYTIRAAQAGKHILCEKPMSVNAEDAKTMLASAHQARMKLMIAYRQQYEPNNRIIQKIVRAKTFGRVKMFEAFNTQNQAGQNSNWNQQQWRHKKSMAGGGALPDIGLYCLNASRFLTGEEPEEVWATDFSTAGDIRFQEVEESINWILRFPSGLIASCGASYGCHNNRHYRFMAENAWFGLDPSFSYNGLKMEISYASGELENRLAPTLRDANQFADEMDHFAYCIINDLKPYSAGEEGVQDHIIMDAIYESVRSKAAIRLERFTAVDVTRDTKSRP